MADRGLMSVVGRWWYVLILCPILAGVVGFAIVQRIPSVYQADETVSVQPTTGADGVPDVQAAQALADSYAEQMRATPILTTAASSVGLGSTPASDLSAMVQSRRLTNTALVRVSVQGTDPEVAAQFAHAIVTAFISQNSQDEVGRYTATQNNLVGLVTQLQNDQTSRNQQIDGLRAEAASPERDAQIGRLEDQVVQLQNSQAAAARSLQDLQLASARSQSALAVIDPAAPPTTPVRPNRLLSVLMAVLAGLFAAIGLVWLGEHRDDRLRDARSVLQALGLSTLARIPRARRGVSIAGPVDERVLAGFSELRSNLLSALHTPRHEHSASSLAVTSAHRGDGTSVVAAQLAIALARTGRRVTLVDADLARPSQAAEFDVESGPGLAGLLSGQVENAVECLQPTSVANLQLLTAGAVRPATGDPAALLLSKRLPVVLEELQRECDVVIIDTPSVPERSESAWLSARTDAVVLVVDARQARKRTVEPAVALLREAGATILGVVLNRANRSAAPGATVFAAPAAQVEVDGAATTQVSSLPARRREVAKQRSAAGTATAAGQSTERISSATER